MTFILNFDEFEYFPVAKFKNIIIEIVLLREHSTVKYTFCDYNTMSFNMKSHEKGCEQKQSKGRL